MRRFIYVTSILTFLAGCQTPPQRSGATQDGLSMEGAVVMKGSDAEGVDDEYAWIRAHAPGAKVTQQALIVHGRRQFDKLDVELPDGSTRAYYFDITATFGMF